MLSALLAKILSFCKLNWASTVKIFLSEKIIFSASMPSFIHFRRILALFILFCFCNAVSWCLLVIFKGDNFRQFFLSVFSSIFKFLVIFLGIPPYLLPDDLNFSWNANSLGLPTSGTTSDVLSSLYRFTALNF